MITTHDYVEILKRNAPDGLDDYWMVAHDTAFVLFLDDKIEIDMVEIGSKTDDEIEKLIQCKLINTYAAAITKWINKQPERLSRPSKLKK